MLKIYGSMLCRDCISCKEKLDQAGIDYDFLDFASDLSYLKEFLKIRDSNPLFSKVKQEGQIGIPCIQFEDGNVTLDWNSIL